MKRFKLPAILLIVVLLLGCIATLLACKHITKPVKKPADLYSAVLNKKVDSIAIKKKERLMSVYNKGKLLKLYHISLGAKPIGAKHFQGDNKTPEGRYFISVKNPNSLFHKSLGVS